MTPSDGDQTCCRLLTPAGMGAIGIVRVDGARAVEVVGDLFRPVSGSRAADLDPQQPERLQYGHIVADGETIDEVLVCSSPTPDGRPRVDINTHGGIRVIERILMALRARGVSVVSDQEQASLAWPATSLIDAEVIQAMAGAKTRRGVRFLMQQGAILPQHLEQLAALAERDHSAALAGLRTLVETAQPGLRLLEGATVAIIGPPNAGKSTLANRLFGAPTALVSPIPGTTRDWVAEPTAIRGIPVTVVDTPGVATTTDPLEELAVRRSKARWGEADLRLLVLDAGNRLPDNLEDALSGGGSSQPLLVVANKSDLPPDWGPGEVVGRFGSEVLSVSALRGDGLAALEQRIADRLGFADWKDDDAGVFSRRQQNTLVAILQNDRANGRTLGLTIRRELLGWPLGATKGRL